MERTVTRKMVEAKRANTEAKIGTLAYELSKLRRAVENTERQIRELEGQHELCEQVLQTLAADEAVEAARAAGPQGTKEA